MADDAGDVQAPFGKPTPARMYDYFLLRHEALRYRAEVKDLRCWVVAAA
jgi:hypothetical protein